MEQKYEYHACPIHFKFSERLNHEARNEEISKQLKAPLNHYAKQGWEYYRMETVQTEVKAAGCLAAIFPSPDTYGDNYHQLVFRKPIERETAESHVHIIK